MTEAAKRRQSDWAWLLFSFRGRINRKPFWIFNLCVFAGALVLGLFTDVSYEAEQMSKEQVLFMLWILWPSLAVQAKRWHDRDKSALWILINFIPVVGPIWAMIENGFLPGTQGENRFGPDPLTGGGMDEG
jgi:uncharacterized membrane protein YhaH (DUF805 family)